MGFSKSQLPRGLVEEPVYLLAITEGTLICCCLGVSKRFNLKHRCLGKGLRVCVYLGWCCPLGVPQA
jgi:hypothetical protein